jgi:hypothetical protein
VKLETAGTLRFAEVSAEQLRAVMSDDRKRGEFVTLIEGPEVFMQAAGEGDGPYQLEYRDGDDERHFCGVGAFRKEDVLRALLWYLEDDARWRTEISWQQLGRKPWWKVW